MHAMRKLFDKYIAQSAKGQMAALVCVFVIVVIVGAGVGPLLLPGSNETTVRFGHDWLWGLMNCIDAGYVGDTLQSSAKIGESGEVISAPGWWVIVTSIIFWMFGISLVSFFTGAITNFLDSRREDIITGNVDYTFSKNYVLVVGVDFQVKNLVKSVMAQFSDSSVVIISDTDVTGLYADMEAELSKRDMLRLYIMRKSICTPESYSRIKISGAKEIYVIGDENTPGRDGMALKAMELISQKCHDEVGDADMVSIKTYLHIEDSIFYAQVRAMELPADKNNAFDLEVYNYYESWAWKCWADKDSTDGEDAYLPIRHRIGTNRAELFVIGAGRMGRAMVNFAMPLMNYGANEKVNRITIFDADELKKGFLPDREILSNLSEIEVQYKAIDGCSDDANEIMLEAAKRNDTSVTVVVAISDPGMALRAYAELSNRLRRKNVSVLVWQRMHSENCPDKKYLTMGGAGSLADKTSVRYFGMTDMLPWKDAARFEFGMAVNYFYSCWFPWGEEYPVSPRAADADFIKISKSMWNNNAPSKSQTGNIVAGDIWAKTVRWKKWASVNSGDTFREKSQLFKGAPYAVAAESILRAEHNRWWTDKLLSGWMCDSEVVTNDESHADKANMLHGDMVPFEQLSEVVKDKDKINIAAMAACGFFNG